MINSASNPVSSGICSSPRYLVIFQEPFSHRDTTLSPQQWFTNSAPLVVHTEWSNSTMKMNHCVIHPLPLLRHSHKGGGWELLQDPPIQTAVWKGLGLTVHILSDKMSKNAPNNYFKWLIIHDDVGWLPVLQKYYKAQKSTNVIVFFNTLI